MVRWVLTETVALLARQAPGINCACKGITRIKRDMVVIMECRPGLGREG